jgi:hypothetical protein
MPVGYTKWQTDGWKDLPDWSTPIDAGGLNHIEGGIADAHAALAQLPSIYVAPGNDLYLKQVGAAGGFSFATITATDAGTGLVSTGTVKWPDGTGGAFTASFDPSGNGYSGYVLTYTGTATKTLTVSGITYDSNGNQLGPTGLVVS